MTDDRTRIAKMLDNYRGLLRQFASGEIPAEAFESAYLARFKNDQDQVGGDEFDVLDELFGDVDDYCEDDRLRNETGGISGEELRNRARTAYSRLFGEAL